MRLISFVLVVFSVGAQATTDLGRALDFRTHSGGKPHVGISYTYGSDADGPSYVFTFLPVVSPVEGRRRLRWNFYQRSTDKFLMPWDDRRSVTLSVLQAQLAGEKDAALIETILKAQNPAKADAVFFVLSDATNRPVYHVSITRLCKDIPRAFDDLTFGRQCDAAQF